MPPAEVKLIGRWPGMSGKGCAVAGTSRHKALSTWTAQ
jgi:hypothetical protein